MDNEDLNLPPHSAGGPGSVNENINNSPLRNEFSEPAPPAVASEAVSTIGGKNPSAQQTLVGNSKSKSKSPSGKTSKAKSIKFSDTTTAPSQAKKVEAQLPLPKDLSVNILVAPIKTTQELELALAKSKSENNSSFRPSRMNVDLSRYDNVSLSDLSLDVRPRIKNIIEELHREHEWAWPPEPGRDVPRLRFFKRKKNKMFYNLEFLDFCTFLAIIIGPLELLVALGFAVVPKTFILAMRESVEITGLVITVFLFQGLFHTYAGILGLALRASRPFEIGFIFPNWALEVAMPLLGIFCVFSAMYMTQDWMVEREMILHLKGYNFHWYSKAMWDSYQSFMSCCGINGYKDWKYHGPLMYNEKQGRVFAVPNSCCLLPNCSSNPTVSNVMTTGCMERTMFTMWAIYIVASVCVIVSIILLCMGHRSVNEAGSYSGDPIHKLLFDDRFSKKRMYNRSNRREELFNLLNYYCIVLGKELGFKDEAKEAEEEENARSKLEGDMDLDKDRYDPPDDYAGKSPPTPGSYDNLRDDLHLMSDPNDESAKGPKVIPKPLGSAFNRDKWETTQAKSKVREAAYAQAQKEYKQQQQQVLKTRAMPAKIEPSSAAEAEWRPHRFQNDNFATNSGIRNAENIVKMAEKPILEIGAGYKLGRQFATPLLQLRTPAEPLEPEFNLEAKTELFSLRPIQPVDTPTHPISRLVDDVSGPASGVASGSGSVSTFLEGPDAFDRGFETETDIFANQHRINSNSPPIQSTPETEPLGSENPTPQTQVAMAPVPQQGNVKLLQVPIPEPETNEAKPLLNIPSKSKLATVTGHVVEEYLKEAGSEMFGLESLEQQKSPKFVESAAGLDAVPVSTIPAEASSMSFNLFSNFVLPKIPPEYLRAAFLAAQAQISPHTHTNTILVPEEDNSKIQGNQSNTAEDVDHSKSRTPELEKESESKDNYTDQNKEDERQLQAIAIAAAAASHRTSSLTTVVDHSNEPFQRLDLELKKSHEFDGSTVISTMREEEKKASKKSGIPTFGASANASDSSNDNLSPIQSQSPGSPSSSRASRRPRSIPVFMSKVNFPKRVGEKSNVTKGNTVMDTIIEDSDYEQSEADPENTRTGTRSGSGSGTNSPSNRITGSKIQRASHPQRSGSANPSSNKK